MAGRATAPGRLKNLRRQWFLFFLAAVLLAAWRYPFSESEIWSAEALKHGCIIGIFFIGGLTLPSRGIGRSLLQWKLHLYIQGFSLAFIPLCFWLQDRGLAWMSYDPLLRQGLIILACVPVTVTSGVALTRMAGGNEAGALCNAALGNLLGVVLTPLLIYGMLGRAGELEYASVVQSLGLKVLLPLLLGQAVQFLLTVPGQRRGRILGVLSQLLLLLMLYLVFSKSLHQEWSLPMVNLLWLLLLLTVDHVLILWASWQGSGLKLWGFSREDRLAAVLVGSQKTMALGIPLISVIYAGVPGVGFLAVPLLCYHALQLLVDGVLASAVAARRPTVEV